MNMKESKKKARVNIRVDHACDFNDKFEEKRRGKLSISHYTTDEFRSAHPLVSLTDKQPYLLSFEFR